MKNNKNIFDELLDKQLKNISKFICNNYNNLDIYFYLGSGFTKYLINKENQNIKINDIAIKDFFLSWYEMANIHFNNKLNLINFNDLLNIDFKYKEKINLINSISEEDFDNKVKNKYNSNLYNLFDCLNTICYELPKINNVKNNIKIITTNHCETIEKYFKIKQSYSIDEFEEFDKNNYSILKLHCNESKFFYSINDYINMFLKNGKKCSYIDKLINVANKLSKSKNKKLIIAFGTRLEEIHIIVFLNQILKKENVNYFEYEIIIQ